MSVSLREMLGNSGPGPCLVCGLDECSPGILSADPVNVEAETVTERLYTVQEPVVHDGRMLYNTGTQIPLSVAVRLRLPGAAQMAVNASPAEAPRRRKAMHSVEDRLADPGENR